MFKVTKDDLTKKTAAQLSALFQEASKGLGGERTERDHAQAALALIRAEIARRGPRRWG